MEYTQMTDVNVTSWTNYNLNKKITEYEKYPSTTTLKHATILAEVIKLHDVHLLNMTPNKNHTLLKLFATKFQTPL